MRNSQVFDTLESMEGGWGDIIQCKLTLTGRLSQIRDKQNNSYWTVQNYEILSRYSEIIITTF